VEVGYAEGRNVVIDYRDADGRPERLPAIAADLLRPAVDLVFARGVGALSAIKQATERIPIVAVDLESDPVAMEFVRTLAQPAPNITGLFLDLPELSGKQFQLLKEIIRPVPRVAILGDLVLNAPQFRATEVAARARWPVRVSARHSRVRGVRRADLAGRQAGGLAGGETDQVRPRHQPQDGQGAPPHDSAIGPAARGPGHRVTPPRWVDKKARPAPMSREEGIKVPAVGCFRA